MRCLTTHRKLLCSLVALLALCVSSVTSAQDEPALRTVIDSYYAAYAQKDFGILVRLWSDKSPDLSARFQELEKLFATEDYAISNLSITRIKSENDRAVLKITADIIITDTRTKQARHENLARSFAMIKESGEWKVWRDAPGSEDLSAYLTKGGELKVSLDPAVFDRFAGLLIGAKTAEERDALVADNRQLLTTDLRIALVRRAVYFQSVDNYSQLLNVYSIIETVAQKTGDREGAAIAEAGLGEANRKLGRNSQAIEHYRKAFAAYEALGNRLQMGLMLDQMGTVYFAGNDYANALESYQKMLALFEASKNTAGVANALEAIGSLDYEQGNYALALELFEKSLKLREGLGRKPEIAATLNNIGNAHYRMENYVAAIECYQKAIAGFEANDDKQAIAGALNNIGGAHYSQGNYDIALESYQKSLKIEEQIRDRPGQATSLLGIGVVYYAQGNYGPALEYLQKNFALVSSLGNKNSMAEALHYIGLAHYRQQNYDAALESYQRSLKVYEESGSLSDQPVMLGLIGGVYYIQGKYDAALESYQRALAQFEALKQAEGVASLTASVASVYHAQSKYNEALESYQKSLARYEAIGNKERVAGVLESIASVYYGQGSYNESLDYAERAAALAKQNNYSETVWRARLTAGLGYCALNQILKAQQSLDESISEIEEMRGQLIPGEQALQRFFKDKSFPYIAMMELMLTQSRIAEAFAYAERAKANALSDVIQSGGVKITKTMTAAEQVQERRLENGIISLKAQINREKQRKRPDEKRLANLIAQLERTRLSYKAFETKLYGAHPQLKSLRGQSQPLKLEDAVGLIVDGETALLEFVVAESRAYLFALTREQGSGVVGRGPVALTENGSAFQRRSGVTSSQTHGPRPLIPTLNVYALDVRRKELADRVSRFREMIAARDEQITLSSRELYDILLKPAIERIGGKSAWTFVPDSILWQLPFQALQSAEGRYLIEDQAISYAPSLTALDEIRKSKQRSRQPASLALLAFANPSMPEAENEVKAISQVYGAAQSRVYAGAQAREQTAKEEAGKFRVIHFAAPARLNDISPMYSHIAVAQPDANAKDDGLFEVWELMNLNLRADLAVLSASETARGQAEMGEATTGLVWALHVAGCPAVVVSKWRADSPGATEMVSEFYRNQRSATPKAQALRQAALKLLRGGQYKHPFYWAALSVIGDAG